MSVLDEAKGLEKRVVARLRELQPLVDEYGELSSLAERLGLEWTPVPPGKSPARKPPARHGARGLAPGERQRQVLDLIRAHPGLTVTEIGQRLDADPTGLYRVVRRLQQEGLVTKRGAQVDPASAGAA